MRVLNIQSVAEACTLGGNEGGWQVVEEGPGGRVGAAGGLRCREELGPAGGSLGPVVGVGGRVEAWCKCPILENILFSA